jgi:hypothetical protein
VQAGDPPGTRANLAKIRPMADRNPAFDEAHAAFMRSGVSVHVASRDAANAPSVERSPSLRIEKTGRGRFRLCVPQPVRLVEIPA